MQISQTSLGTVYRYENPSELVEDCRKKPPRFTDREFKQWAGQTWAEALSAAEHGDTTLVVAAEKLIAELECSIEAPRSVWESAHAGAYPMVPDFLAGHPNSMRRRVQASDDRSPLRVVIDLTSSCSIDKVDLAKRGIAYLALAMFLGNERPVDIETVVGLGGKHSEASFVVVPIPSRPLDLAVACNALSSPGFSRGLGYEMCYKTPKITGAWPWRMTGGVGPEFVRREREILGLNPEDVLAPPMHYTDPAVTDPVGFVRRAIEEHTKRE